MRRLALGLFLGLSVPKVAIAGEPGELSQQGTRRGGVEIGLGLLLTGAAGGLIGFGAVQLVRAREHVEFCGQGVTVIDETQEPGGIDPCVFDPPPLGFASAGLAWGFSVPLLVGSGLLFARAHKIRKDAREFEAMQLTLAPWWQRDGGGATLRLRF